jgi:hypothetical protein
MTLYNIPPGEEWIDFYEASEQLRERLSLSRGEAERTLRGLCAGGTVRTLRAVYEVDGSAPVEPLEIIKPSEWLHDEVDLSADDQTTAIEVCEDDLNHWLDKQQPDKPEPAKSSRNPKSSLAQQAIDALWLNGIPDPKDLTNKDLERLVTGWIADYCKQHNLPKRDISRDTILRTAGRK